MGSTLTPTPCCSYAGLNKRPWTPEEDLRLVKYIQAHGEGNWRTLPKKAGLQRCGKGCRLRWMNYLRPNVKRGHISPEEEEMIIRLHKLLGNRWSLIAGRIPGRTDNEVKKYWNTHLRKKFNATKGFIRNHRALHGKQPGFDQTDADKNICGGQNGSSFSPYKDASSSGLAVNDLNNGSACWDIREIVSILMGDEDLCNRTEYVATENFKQSNDRFHDTVDLNASTINHFHTAWAHGNYDPSSVTSIYSPEFEPYNTCPLECSIESHTGGLYEQYTMPGFFTSMGQQLDDIVSPNINSGEKPTGDASNLQSKTAAEAQMQIHIPPYGLTYEDNSMAIDCDVFDQCSINMVLPELGQNMSLNSCLQPTDPTANQCSETWLSSFDWFDCIQQLDN